MDMTTMGRAGTIQTSIHSFVIFKVDQCQNQISNSLLISTSLVNSYRNKGISQHKSQPKLHTPHSTPIPVPVPISPLHSSLIPSDLRRIAQLHQSIHSLDENPVEPQQRQIQQIAAPALDAQ